MAEDIVVEKGSATGPTEKPTPIRRDTEQQQRIDAAMERIQETRLRIKGNPKCQNGCHGQGYFGIQTIAMADGRWELTLLLCKCSNQSEYAHLSDKMKELGERMNQFAAMTFEDHEVLFRHTFFGGLKTVGQKLAGSVKQQWKLIFSKNPKQ